MKKFISSIFIVIFAIAMTACASTTAASQPIDAISGKWVGTAKSGDFEFGVTFVVGEKCSLGEACGTFDFPDISCAGTLAITNIDENVFEFQASDRTSGCDPSPDNRDSLELLPDGTLLFISTSSTHDETRAILTKEK
jgi:hypothetical protein